MKISFDIFALEKFSESLRLEKKRIEEIIGKRKVLISDLCISPSHSPMATR